MDHLVLTVASIDRTIDFYSRALGMRPESFGNGRMALHFGNGKINLHEHGREFSPRAGHPTLGSADFCFVVDCALDDVRQRLETAGVNIIEGPVRRTGASGPIDSIYVRDPDGNLIELGQQV